MAQWYAAKILPLLFFEFLTPLPKSANVSAN